MDESRFKIGSYRENGKSGGKILELSLCVSELRVSNLNTFLNLTPIDLQELALITIIETADKSQEVRKRLIMMLS